MAIYRPPEGQTDVIIDFGRHTAMGFFLRCDADSQIIRTASLWFFSDSVALDKSLLRDSWIVLAVTVCMLFALPFLRGAFSTSNELLAWVYAIVPIFTTFLLIVIGGISLLRVNALSGTSARPFHETGEISALWPGGSGP
jgi:hypothetical protein